MDQVINLAPLFAARRIAAELTERCGIEYFTLAEAEGPSFRLDPDKLDRVLDLARRDAERQAPWLPAATHDLELCRRLLRRSLIHRLAVGMIEAGY